MALTFSSLTEQTAGHKRKITGLLAITAGGGTVTAAALGLTQLDTFDAKPTGGYVFDFVPSTGVLTARYADYDAVADGVLIAHGAAAVSNIPVEAEGY